MEAVNKLHAGRENPMVWREQLFQRSTCAARSTMAMWLQMNSLQPR